MISFDIQNRVVEYLKRCRIFIIPSNNLCKQEDYYIVLNELSFKDPKISDEISYDNIEQYIKEYYEEVLCKLDPTDILHKLNESYLTSDERCENLSKRNIVCEWIKLYTNEDINEMYIDEHGNIVKQERPKYIREILEKVIKDFIKDMKGFETLRGLYLYEKSEKFESIAMRYIEDKDIYLYYIKMSNLLRSEAESFEYIYHENREYKRCI